MKFFKYLSFSILLIALQIIILFTGHLLVVHTLNVVKNNFSLYVFFIVQLIILTIISFLCMALSKYIHKLNTYNDKGKNLILKIMLIISLIYTILNISILSFDNIHTFYGFFITVNYAVFIPFCLYASHKK